MFDYIISNPPYAKNLHLQIIDYVYKCAKDVVNISPDFCYSDLLCAMSGKYHFSCQKHLYSLDSLTLEELQKYFAITLRVRNTALSSRLSH